MADIRKYLADLELLTYGKRKVNPHSFCIDEVDHKIVDYLMHYKGATTPELAEYMKINRWLVLNRLRKIQKASQKQFGKAVIDYYARREVWQKEGMVDKRRTNSRRVAISLKLDRIVVLPVGP